MNLNLRWIVQAVAFIGCIFFFINIWEKSKQLLVNFNSSGVVIIGIYTILFLLCFLLMAITSYLKQKFNGTLKNPIPFFEKILSKIGLV
ncbi:MAG: hypothetical protein ACE5HX_14675 [bacterium]